MLRLRPGGYPALRLPPRLYPIDAYYHMTSQHTYDGDGALYRRRSEPMAGGSLFADSFASGNAQAWVYNAYQSVPFSVDGRDAVKSTGTGSSWEGSFYRKGTLTDGQVARFDFKLGSALSGAHFGLETSSGPYYRFALLEHEGKLKLQVYDGSQWLYPAVLVDPEPVGTWYTAELQVDEASGFRVTVWPTSDPGRRSEARYELPGGLVWRFHHWVYSGTVYLDIYEESIPTQPAQDLVLIGRHYEQDLVSGRVTKRYYAEGRLLASRVAEGGNDVLRFVQADHLGSSSTITDASGQLVARERYGAFGERRRGEEPKTTEYLYTGQRLSSPSTLYHFTDGKSPGRFYDPLLARFLQPDSVIPGIGTQALNRYSYSYNNPLRLVDPSGNDPIDALYFIAGVSAQWGYNNAWVSPQAQAQLATQPGESGWMTAGRHVGNVVSMVQGAGEVIGGGGAAVAGVAACATGVGCLATAPAIALGSAEAAHGAGVGLTAAGQEGQMLGDLLAASSSGTRPPGYEKAKREWRAQNPSAPEGPEWQLDHRIPRKYEWQLWESDNFAVNDPSNLRLVPRWVNLRLRSQWDAWERHMALEAGVPSGRWRPTLDQLNRFASDLDDQWGTFIWTP